MLQHYLNTSNNNRFIDRLIDFSEQLYNFLVSGTATYTNGFLVSIEKIDVTNMEQRVTRDIVNGASVPTALVRGRLNLRDVKVGFDVDAHINDEHRHYTGAFPHILVQYELNVSKAIYDPLFCRNKRFCRTIVLENQTYYNKLIGGSEKMKGLSFHSRKLVCVLVGKVAPALYYTIEAHI